MNAPQTLHQLTPPQAFSSGAEAHDIDLREYLDILFDSRWLIAVIALVTFVLGTAYAFLAKPVFETNLLIQVEDSATSAKSFLGDAASLFDVKTPAAGEIEIIRSRMVVGSAVDNTLYYIDAQPRYIPLIGEFLARHAKTLSDPGIFGLGGWVRGTESIHISQFDVPEAFEGTKFTLTAMPNNGFSLSHPDLDHPMTGRVGQKLNVTTADGPLSITVAQIDAKPGAQFRIVRSSRLQTITDLQDQLKLTEKGRQSGVIDVTLDNTDPQRLRVILNEIASEYVKQNVERKSAEAEKTLAFLNVQLPALRKQLEQAEDAYTRYRNRAGTVSLDSEAQTALEQSVDLQSKLEEAKQKRLELISRFTPAHPAVRTLDAQIASWQQQIASLDTRIKSLPTVQRDSVRLERDVRVNNELYEQLRNNALQLQLIREGKTGNVRVIDQAARPDEPIRPKKPLTIVLSLLVGILGGGGVALIRSSLFRGIRSTQEIEVHTGLNVYSTVPLSDAQQLVAQKVSAKAPGVHVLAHMAPQDPAIESLRSLRTALQFSMLDARNNRILITGATPGLGKSFISANFAAVLAAGGKRVLLVDADLRKGHLNQYFGVARKGGLSEVIVGEVDAARAVRAGILPNLDLLTTGTLPPNPAELMVSSAFLRVLDWASGVYDLVLIDSAPVLIAADTVSVALHTSTVLFVARAEHTQLGELVESSRRLQHAGVTVTGAIFNALDVSRRHYGAHAYQYGAYKYRTYKYGSAAD